MSETSANDVVTTNPASARVKRIDKPIASPACCVLCGKSEHAMGFADPRLDFEFYGTVYLCGDCIGDFASLFGWVEPSRAEGILTQNTHLLEQNFQLVEQVRALEKSVESLTNYRTASNNYSRLSDVINMDPASNAPVISVGSVLDEDVTDSVGDSTAASPDVSEPVSEQGPTDISATGSDELFSPAELSELGLD